MVSRSSIRIQVVGIGSPPFIPSKSINAWFRLQEVFLHESGNRRNIECILRRHCPNTRELDHKSTFGFHAGCCILRTPQCLQRSPIPIAVWNGCGATIFLGFGLSFFRFVFINQNRAMRDGPTNSFSFVLSLATSKCSCDSCIVPTLVAHPRSVATPWSSNTVRSLLPYV